MAFTTKMFEDSILVSIECRSPGNQRKVSSSGIDAALAESKTDKDSVRVTKVLLESPERRAVENLFGAVKAWLGERQIPLKAFLAGCFLVHKKMVPEFAAYISGQHVKLAGLIDTMIEKYPERKAEAQERLGQLYDEADYPTPAAYRKSASMQVRYLEFGVPDDLAGIDQDLFKEQKKAAEAEWARAVEDIRLALRKGMQGMVAHLVDVLGAGEDGKAKIFKGSSFDKLDSFLKYFEQRDITDDADLKALVEQARKVMEDADPEAIRKDGTLKGKIKSSFENLKASLDGMVEEQKIRLISFED